VQLPEKAMRLAEASQDLPTNPNELSDLDDWQTIALSSLDLLDVTREQFHALIAGGGAPSVYRLETGPGGAVEGNALRYEGRYNEMCRNYVNDVLSGNSFSWDPEYIFLLNRPCYVVTSSGAVILPSGEVVSETLFPSGYRSVERCVGGGLRAANLQEALQNAPEATDGVWAPLLSFGSTVYGHAVAESMVQDAVFHDAGLSPNISYVASAWPSGAEKLAIARAQSRVEQFASLVVKVPRVVFASKLYRHLPLGRGFQHFAERTRTRSFVDVPADGVPATKIYVPRLGVPGRRMTNEAQLVDELLSRGFKIVSGEKLSFDEQVRAFRDAILIVGPYGSGLINAAFAAPQATLCELRSLNNPHHSPNWDDFYFALAAAKGFSYGIHVTENPPNADSWKCNIPDVLEFVDMMSTHAKAGDAASPDRPSRDAAPAGTSGDAAKADCGFWEIPDHSGTNFYSIIVKLHQQLRPASYFEIASQSDDMLAVANCPAIIVAPELSVNQEVLGDKPVCMMFRMSSDAFFAEYSPRTLLGRPLDMAFINGVRLFEFVLRDFANTEKSMRRNSVILLHDCAPTDTHIGRRAASDHKFGDYTRHPYWWAGDCWKVIAALRKFRPDLHVQVYNAFPTGFAIITNLDPQSDVLMERYFDIVAEFRALELAEYGVERYLHTMQVRDTGEVDTFAGSLWL
jgi:capsular polysaccharide biosynthesis protein